MGRAARSRRGGGGTICICAQETARYTSFATSLARLHVPRGWEIHEVNGPYTAYSRHAAAANFGGDHLLFLDDDHTYPVDLVDRLLRHRLDIVGPMYVDRRRLLPCVNLNGQTGLVQVSNTGAAGLMIHRRVFEAMDPPYFESGMVTDADGALVHVPEDAYFCMKAAKAGFATYIDTDVVLGHIAAATLVPVRSAEGWLLELNVGEETLVVPLAGT